MALAKVLKKYSSFLMIAIFSIASLALASTTGDPDGDVWKETGLTIQGVREGTINETNCRRGALQFSACVNALAVALTESATTPKSFEGPEFLVLVPTEFYDRQKSWFAGATEVFGDFTLAKVAPLTAKEYRPYFQRRKQIIAAIGGAFRSGKSKIDFDQISRRLPATAAMAATLANSYYSVAVDPHTYLVPSSRVLTPTSAIGIGANVQVTKTGLYLDPIPNAPAANAGLRKGDILDSIDGVSMKDQSLESVGRRIFGAIGTPLKISVLRGGEKIEATVYRAPIVRENISVQILDDDSRRIAHIRLRAFLNNSCAELGQKLNSLRSEKIDGIVLDLRDNPGGSSPEAVCVTSLFLPKGLHVIKLADEDWSDTVEKSAKTDLPTAILIDSRSGSSSEITAGALQEHGRAWLVGERTYGKGSWQGVAAKVGLQGVSLATTIGLYIFKSSRSPQLVGVLPDFEVFADPQAKSESDMPSFREEDQISPLPASTQYYERPAKLAQLREMRRCLDINGRAKLRYERLYNSGNPADLQLLTALEVLTCQKQTEGLTVSVAIRNVLDKKNCEGARLFFESVEKHMTQLSFEIQQTRSRLKSDSTFSSSLEFYRKKRSLTEQDISDELSLVENELNALSKSCGLAFRLHRWF